MLYNIFVYFNYITVSIININNISYLKHNKENTFKRRYTVEIIKYRNVGFEITIGK